MTDSEKPLQDTKIPDRSGPAAPSGDPQAPPREIGGREGPDPVRYGDWENNGIASDF